MIDTIDINQIRFTDFYRLNTPGLIVQFTFLVLFLNRSPASTRQLRLHRDIEWIQTKIVSTYVGFQKDPLRNEWKQQPTFENALGTPRFREAASKALELFKKYNHWEDSKKTFKTRPINLLYMTAARYLLVTHILYEQSNKKLIACKEIREYGKLKKYVIPASGVCFPKPYGSATCTSDYDVGLIGKDAGVLTRKFNDYFETTFKKPSELVFDTNVYAFTLEFAMPFMFLGLPGDFSFNVKKKEQTVTFKMQELASAYYKVFKYNKNFSKIMSSGAMKAIMAPNSKQMLNKWLEKFSYFNRTERTMSPLGIHPLDFRRDHNKMYQQLVEKISLDRNPYNAGSLGNSVDLIYKNNTLFST